MNIYSKEGDKVKALFNAEGNLMNGHDYEKESASKYLEKDKIYTVDHTVVHSWNTVVYLKEFPNVKFNSVHFEDYLENPPGGFTIEDMNNAYKDGMICGFERCGQGISSTSFARFMKLTYNVDITQ